MLKKSSVPRSFLKGTRLRVRDGSRGRGDKGSKFGDGGGTAAGGAALIYIWYLNN